MASLSLGGSEEPMKSILIGGVQDQGSRSVPVVLNTTVLIPNTTATVMQTCVPGECTLTQPLS